jgi:hypothetical protein
MFGRQFEPSQLRAFVVLAVIAEVKTGDQR